MPKIPQVRRATAPKGSLKAVREDHPQSYRVNGKSLHDPIRFIDLFCGIGGFRLAFERIGAKCVFSSDSDKFSRQTYEANFGEVPHGDMSQRGGPATRVAQPGSAA